MNHKDYAVWPEIFAGTRLPTQSHRHKEERFTHAHVYEHLPDGSHDTPLRTSWYPDSWAKGP